MKTGNDSASFYFLYIRLSQSFVYKYTNNDKRKAAIMINEGDKAPAFELPGDNDKIISSKDLKGNFYVLFFYPKDNTPGCTKEAIAFTELHNEFKKLGVEVFGISPDSPKKHNNFITKHDLTVSLISDEEKELLQNYGIWVEKSMYGKKYMGVERSTFIIDQKGKVAKIWRKVKVPGHAEEVLEAVREIAGK